MNEKSEMNRENKNRRFLFSRFISLFSFILFEKKDLPLNPHAIRDDGG
jgi:hypothetical protein